MRGPVQPRNSFSRYIFTFLPSKNNADDFNEGDYILLQHKRTKLTDSMRDIHVLAG